jgi:hypothetical protein
MKKFRAHVTPNVPESLEIANHLRQAIDELYYGVKEPK